MNTRLILSLALCLLTVGCADPNNPPPANNSSAALRSPNNPADQRAVAAHGGPAPGQGPGLVDPNTR